MPHKIDCQKCAVCGACEVECPTGSISIDKSNRYYVINAGTCSDCASCVDLCPTEAITPEEIVEIERGAA